MLSPWKVLEIIATKDLNIAQYAYMILFSANNINMHIYIQNDIDIQEMQWKDIISGYINAIPQKDTKGITICVKGCCQETQWEEEKKKVSTM